MLNWLKLAIKYKKFNKNMTYTFNKENFKNHLRNNATRSWFSKSASNIRYQHSSGGVEEYDSSPYLGYSSVKVNEVLCEPSQPDRTAEKVGAVAGMVAGTTGIGLATCLAPFTFGGSILAAGAAGAGFLGSAAALDYSSRTEEGKVYFTLAGDNSEWVAEDGDGVSSIAYHIY
jgi:hypothetical protein